MTGSWASYSYFPYARSGMGARVDGTLVSGSSRPQVSVGIAVSDGDASSMPIELYGPGDVARLDAAQVVRTDPTDGAGSHPPNIFPMIEFARPELPWAFTPEATTAATATAGARLKPWLTLVTVRADKAGLEIDPTGAALPVLTAPLSELPPSLDDAWAWAHVQAVGTVTAAQLQATATTAPSAVISRLLSPRLLDQYTSYLACVVPTYADGADAALGSTPEGSLAPAWPRSAQDPAKLPVLYHWSFTTGEQGDFESLARRLSALASPTQTGTRPLDAQTPGASVPSAGLIRLGGALRPTTVDFGPAPAAGFASSLEPLLNAPSGAGGNAGNVLAPPIYGRWQARVTQLPPAAGLENPVPWLRDLNLDPRNRAAAEFGALAVQREADALMASAWRQLGDLELANQALRQAQLARAGGKSILSGRLAPRSAAALLALSAPVHARVALPVAQRSATARTVSAALGDSALGEDAVGPAMRRLVRPEGPLIRRFDPSATLRIDGIVNALAVDSTALAPARHAPDGTQTANVIGSATAATIDGTQFTGTVTVTVPAKDGTTVQTTSVTWSTVQPALAAAQGAITSLLSEPDPSAPPATSVSELASAVLAGLDPDQTVPARLSRRLTVTDPNWNPKDPLEPMLAAPQFPQPLWESLSKISQQLIAPGLENIPPETVTVLEPNVAFVNAFMVGANHELARQLVWRHFPTDQRATYFRQFWDPSAAVSGSAGRQLEPDDMPPIDAWGQAADLLNVGVAPTGGLLVLVVRGELLRRFPNASVYAVPSDGQTPPGPVFPGTDADPATTTAGELYPLFQGRLDPDLSYFGFDMPATQASQWFFVLQQHPTEPRYGLEPPDPADLPPQSWAELSWTNLAGGADPSTLRSGGGAVYAPASAPAGAQLPGVAESDGLSWGHDAGQMAAIALRDPFRVAIWAQALVNPS